MHMIYEMRYSYFGRSGWQSEASNDAAKLFDDARLDGRHYFLEKIALRSLADQSDGDFGLIVLSAEALPERHKSRLQQVCGDMLGDRAHVIFRGPDSAGTCFTRYRKATFNRDPWSTQIVLDDDDAVSADFTEKLRAEAMAAKKLRAPGEEYCFLSHARGISAVFRDGQISLRHRLNAATNLGLAVTAPTGSRRQPFGIAHKKILERRPVREGVRGVGQHQRGVAELLEQLPESRRPDADDGDFPGDALAHFPSPRMRTPGPAFSQAAGQNFQ